MHNAEDPSPTRSVRRIVQQPLRTDPPVGLIGGDADSGADLEARLKSRGPLITFPSLTHFLAEPPRPWAAVVMARSGAWDPRLDAYVRRRRHIALFGLDEESYGWPETVARVRELSDLDPWLESLNQPDPIVLPEATRKRKALVPRKPPRSEPSPAAPRAAAANGEAPAEQAPAAPAAREAAPSVKPKQLELALPPAPRKRARPERPKHRTPRAAAARAAAVRPARREPRAASPAREVLVTARTELKPQASRAFTQLAAELGLQRAFELLEEIRLRARRRS